MNFAKFLRILFTEHFWATASEQVTVYHYSACRRQNRYLVPVGELVKLFYGNYWQNPKTTAAVHYFHYNYHHHHYHYFHYNWKMHLYRLKILLTILFTVIWFPICFNLSSFFSPNKGKYGPEKTPYLNTFRAVLFTLTCLYLFTLTYPYLCSLYTIIRIW